MRRRVTWAVAFGLVVVCTSSVAAAVSAKITGTSGDDVIRGTAGADTILGRGGDDRIFALAGNDRITPGAGRDTVACGTGVDRVQADAADNVSGDCEVVAGAVPTPRLVLLGHPAHVQLAFPFADEFNTVLNRAAKPRDIVLFVLGAKDGPMPQTRMRVEELRGVRYAGSAIFVVDTGGVDPELLQLVILEMRELLRANQIRGSFTMPVIRHDDPNLQLLFRGLLSTA